MKTRFSGLFLLSIFYSSFLIAQEISISTVQDSIANQGISFGEINLPTPSSYIENYQYDPVSDMYYYNLSVGDYNINYPIILSPEEYKKLILVEDLKEYYKSKIDAAEGKKDGTDEMQKNLIPEIYVNSKIFENIFGERLPCNRVEKCSQGRQYSGP